MGMLVVQRKRGEKVMVGDKIEIIVLEIEPTRVRLGFLAPSDVTVHRLEVWDRIQAEGRKPKRKAS